MSVTGARIEVLGKKTQWEKQTRIQQPSEVKRLLRFVCMYILLLLNAITSDFCGGCFHRDNARIPNKEPFVWPQVASAVQCLKMKQAGGQLPELTA